MRVNDFDKAIRDILNKFNYIELEEIEYGSDLFEELFTLFLDNNEMPYGVAKARTGMPDEFIQNYVDDML